MSGFRRSQVAIAALFCFLGFQYGTWVSRVPALKTHLGLSTAEVGLLLLAPGLGATVSFPLVARLMKQLGSRRLSTVSAFAMLAVLGALSVAPTFGAAVVVLFLDGLAIACLNVAMNAQGAALEARYRRNTMAKLHAVFSGGTFAAALLASGVSALTGKLPAHFAVAGVLLLALLAVSWTGTLTDSPAAGVSTAATVSPGDGVVPEAAVSAAAGVSPGDGVVPAAAVSAGAGVSPEAGGQPDAHAAPARRRWAVPATAVLWLCAAMVFGEFTEGAMNDWSALYLRDVAHAATELTPLGIATVSAMMVLARLFADGWRARWGDRRVMLAGTALAAAGLGGALLLGGWAPALAGFACVGLGMAAVTPCVNVAAARQGPDALALVASAGTGGLLVGPPVIGFVAGVSSLAWGMAVVVGALIVIFLSTTRLEPAPGEPGSAGAERDHPAPADSEHIA